MNALKNNAEKIVFVLVVLLCGYIAFSSIPPADDTMKVAEGNVDTIERTLRAKNVSPTYIFSQINQDKSLVYVERYTGNQQRSNPTQPVRSDLPGWVAYPQPERPAGEQKLPVPVEEFKAEAAPITDLRIMAEQGRNIIAFKKPEGYKFMQLVRVEIYRGKQPDKLERVEAVLFGPEDGPAPEAIKPVEAPKAPAPAETGRRRGGATTGRNQPAPPPNPLAGMTVFIDSNLEQKVKYFYKVVPVARMLKTPDVEEIVKNAVGDPEKIIIYRAPQGVEKIAPGNPESKTAIFKGPSSEIREVTTPSNFQVRLAGIIGTFSPPGTPEPKMSRDYQGNFEVKVWVPEAQEFKEITMQAAPGQPLKGQLSYKNAATKETKVVDFDSGYVLQEIKWGSRGGVEKVIGPDGKETEVTRPIIPNEVAVLLETKTKKLEEFPKRSEFERKADNVKYYEALDKERREQDKANQERFNKVSERIKAYDDAKKTEETKK
jgi:hypothetical protein